MGEPALSVDDLRKRVEKYEDEVTKLLADARVPLRAAKRLELGD